MLRARAGHDRGRREAPRSLSVITERKPHGLSFESWVDRQIREAAERGSFDDLPGSGEPLPDLDQPHDEHWWIKRKLRREGLSYLPPSLALRKEAAEALENARNAGSEDEVRAIVEGINEQIRDAIRFPRAGPPLHLLPFDVEKIVAEWREAGATRRTG